MGSKLYSCTVVPRNFYVERSADNQIKKIINGMGRPGYVLVARQMGKTNLLLHTRDIMQTHRQIFSFIDFSTIGSISETDCFNKLIDDTIATHEDALSIAEPEIQAIRNLPNYSGQKMFTKELRVLLKYVDKLVFILDEIDALTRTEYSDHIFSTIRSHYFMRVNFPELNKLTYILSGVIEPKHIIKDSNISPFNIGEKIYMNDFTKDEFLRFINNTSIPTESNMELTDRIYYWTKGNPRLTWDVCTMVEENDIKEAGALDSLISERYLTTFDQAPIDGIRQKVSENAEIRDALIQLYFNKGEELSDSVKSSLYLAGIIDYDNTMPHIKNPILEKSLSYEWLLSLQNLEKNHLTVAEKCIHIERDYKKAINHLKMFFKNASKDNDLEEIDLANFLMGEAYLRQYDIDESLTCLCKITNANRMNSKWYFKALLLEGHGHNSNEESEKALSCYEKVIAKEKEIDKDTYNQALLAKVDVLLSDNNEINYQEAEAILLKMLQSANQENNNKIMAVCLYRLAQIEINREDIRKAIEYLNTALMSAQENERQVLLYTKLFIADEEAKKEIARELYNSLELIKNRPEVEPMDNPLELNLLTACHIFADYILFYPQYDITVYLRRFLYDSKENALLYIYSLLEQEGDERSRKLLNVIDNKLKEPEWSFDNDQLIQIAIYKINHERDYSLATEIISQIENKKILDIKANAGHLFRTVMAKNFQENDAVSGLRNYRIFDENRHVLRSIDKGTVMEIEYLYNIFLYYKKDFGLLRKTGAEWIDKAKTYIESPDDVDIVPRIKNMIKNLTEIERNLFSKMSQLGINPYNINKIGRNDKVSVRYLSNGNETIGKFKNLEHDIRAGLCEIICIQTT